VVNRECGSPGKLQKIKAALADTLSDINLGAILEGTGTVWIDDLTLQFEEESGIREDSKRVLIPESPQTVSNLYVLGQVWRAAFLYFMI
jgi:hypothetical protein